MGEECGNRNRLPGRWTKQVSYSPFYLDNLIPICHSCNLSMGSQNLNEFIANSAQESKNKIALDLIKFIFTNIYKNNLFYSDSHYGNIIIQD